MSVDSEPDSDADEDPTTDRAVRPPELTSTVVRYEERRNRITFNPVDPSPEERLTAWLTVDSDAVRDLESVR